MNEPWTWSKTDELAKEREREREREREKERERQDRISLSRGGIGASYY